MNNLQSLSHTEWEQVSRSVDTEVSEKKQYGKLRIHLGELINDLARQKESTVVEGHLMGDHVHMLLSIPPKYAVSQVIGFIKGKSAIHIARTYVGMSVNERTSRVRISGHVATLYLPLAWMRKQSANISISRKKRISE